MTEMTGERILIDYLDPDRQPRVAEICILADVVEIWAGGQLAGTFDRDRMAGWLAEPHIPTPLHGTLVTLSVDLSGRLVVYLPGVPTWTHASEALHRLRAALL